MKRERRTAKAGEEHTEHDLRLQPERLYREEENARLRRTRSGYFQPAEAPEVDPIFVVANGVITLDLLSAPP